MGTVELLLKDETYKVIGICMEAHRELGHGFLEIVYKDAIEYELNSRGIPYEEKGNIGLPTRELSCPITSLQTS